MGASKRVAELVVHSMQKRAKTIFSSVRFGNVLGSSGSVIPTFRQQIATGGPVTVTHPEVYRFFMSIPEAVGLILQSGALSQGGEVFVLDMGEPIKIHDLARQMIELCGFVPDEDIKIEFTGLRPGEKLFEEPIHQAENVHPTIHPKLLSLVSNGIYKDIIPDLESLREDLAKMPDVDIKKWLYAKVPEYRAGS